jgi:oligopeptidase B
MRVPFVDLISSLSDPSLPLTATEWEEWGNPKNPIEFDYLLRYTPYENIKPQSIFTLP